MRMLAAEFKKNKAKMSKQYRTKISILGDVLDTIKNAGRDGVIVSVISRRAKLSHYPAVEKCEELISAGLVKSSINEGKKVFMITEKGLEFFNEYQEFQNLTESLNLKY